jgi:hypothetical protein
MDQSPVLAIVLILCLELFLNLELDSYRPDTV